MTNLLPTLKTPHRRTAAMLDPLFDSQFGDYSAICGTDEAGRGPLAGPVVAGACILPDGYVPDGLDDSKKLSEKKREKLYDEITENAITYRVGIQRRRN